MFAPAPWVRSAGWGSRRWPAAPEPHCPNTRPTTTRSGRTGAGERAGQRGAAGGHWQATEGRRDRAARTARRVAKALRAAGGVMAGNVVLLRSCEVVLKPASRGRQPPDGSDFCRAPRTAISYGNRLVSSCCRMREVGAAMQASGAVRRSLCHRAAQSRFEHADAGLLVQPLPGQRIGLGRPKRGV